jgi:hypothetical protein
MDGPTAVAATSSVGRPDPTPLLPTSTRPALAQSVYCPVAGSMPAAVNKAMRACQQAADLRSPGHSSMIVGGQTLHMQTIMTLYLGPSAVLLSHQMITTSGWNMSVAQTDAGWYAQLSSSQ